MRYNVHPSRALRNRIAKSIGVLVAAALIATLGLPSVAQAQTIAGTKASTFVFTEMNGLHRHWTTRLATHR